MRKDLDCDWKARIAKDYFAMTWDGPEGNGIKDGKENLDHLYRAIDETFHKDYDFMRGTGEVLNSGTDELKRIMYNLTAPLANLKMTSFDIMSVTDDSVSFQSTSIADKKDSDDRYTQCLQLTYYFKDKKVCKTVVHYHSNYTEH